MGHGTHGQLVEACGTSHGSMYCMSGVVCGIGIWGSGLDNYWVGSVFNVVWEWLIRRLSLHGRLDEAGRLPVTPAYHTATGNAGDTDATALAGMGQGPGEPPQPEIPEVRSGGHQAYDYQTSQLSLFHSETQGFWSILKVIPSNLTVKMVSLTQNVEPNQARGQQ